MTSLVCLLSVIDTVLTIVNTLCIFHTFPYDSLMHLYMVNLLIPNEMFI